MTVADVFEVFVCILAVYGVYALICRFLARGCYKGDLAVGLRVQTTAAERDPAALADGIRRAHFLTEGQRGSMLPPVILLDSRPDSEMDVAELLGQGEIYYRME